MAKQESDDVDLDYRLMRVAARRDELESSAAVIAERQREVQEDITALVAEMRAAGVTWQRIGSCLGVSRQAAQQRYAPTTPTVRISNPSGTRAATLAVLKAAEPYRVGNPGDPNNGVTTVTFTAAGRATVIDAIAAAEVTAGRGWSAELTG